RSVVLGIVAAVVYAPWGWFYQTTYGSWFGPTAVYANAASWASDIPEGLAGVWLSPARGFLVYQPWLLLLPLACFAPRTKNADALPRGWALYCVSVILLESA